MAPVPTGALPDRWPGGAVGGARGGAAGRHAARACDSRRRRRAGAGHGVPGARRAGKGVGVRGKGGGKASDGGAVGQAGVPARAQGGQAPTAHTRPYLTPPGVFPAHFHGLLLLERDEPQRGGRGWYGAGREGGGGVARGRTGWRPSRPPPKPCHHHAHTHPPPQWRAGSRPVLQEVGPYAFTVRAGEREGGGKARGPARPSANPPNARHPARRPAKSGSACPSPTTPAMSPTLGTTTKPLMPGPAVPNAAWTVELLASTGAG